MSWNNFKLLVLQSPNENFIVVETVESKIKLVGGGSNIDGLSWNLI